MFRKLIDTTSRFRREDLVLLFTLMEPESPLESRLKLVSDEFGDDYDAVIEEEYARCIGPPPDSPVGQIFGRAAVRITVSLLLRREAPPGKAWIYVTGRSTIRITPVMAQLLQTLQDEDSDGEEEIEE